MSNQNQLQPNITSQEVVLHFEKEIPDEYRSAFGEYFLGIKDFVKFCYGKNIAMNIEINGSLIIKAFSKNPEDKILVEIAFGQLLGNLQFLFKNQKTTVFLPPNIEFQDIQKTIMALDTKLRILEINLKQNILTDFDNEFTDIKKMVELIQLKSSQIIGYNNELQLENNSLILKIIDLTTELKSKNKLLIKNQMQSIIVDDKIDTLLSYLSILKTGLDNQDTSQISSMTSAIKDFWTLNKDKLMLIQISGNTLYQILKTIFKF